MYVNVWMNLLKRSPSNEKYRHMAMEELDGLFRVSWGVREPYTTC